jgi:hypothetical protein
VFEILKYIAEQLAQALGKAKIKKREDSQKALATDLFSAYIELVRIFMSAESVLAALTVFVSSPETERVQMLNGIRDLLRRQEMALQMLRVHLAEVSSELIVLSAEDFEKLAWLASGKHGDVQRAIWDLGKERIYRADINTAYPYPPSSRIFDLAAPTERVIEQGRAYIESGAPRARLEEMRAAVERIRTILAENFTISDVLVDLTMQRRRDQQ